MDKPPDSITSITPAEFCERADTDFATLLRWHAAGHGPRASRDADQVLYRLSEVDAWLAESESDWRPRWGGLMSAEHLRMVESEQVAMREPHNEDETHEDRGIDGEELGSGEDGSESETPRDPELQHP